ncbi:MAG: DUF3108 domain-containing protein [Desulfuromonadia bacterium]
MRRVVTLCLTLLILFPHPPSASGVTVPERFTFDLHWGIVRAGGAIQEIREENGEIVVSSRAFSADWLSGIYPVDDRVESRLRKGERSILGEVREFRLRTREGKRVKDRQVIFDHGKGVAHYRDLLKKESLEIPIVPTARDVYSSFQYLRTMPLEVGKTVYLDVVDSKRLWRVEVKVLRKERLKTVLGVVETIVVNPMVKSEGIFEKTGAIHIWLTDDQRRIPVKMQTKVMIGSITATLVKVE